MNKKERLELNIEETVELIRGHKSKIEELQQTIHELKDELRPLLELYGENWSDDDGYARLIAEGERHYYDSRMLDKLVLEEPLQYGWLTEYRVSSTTPGQVQVK